jgi:hypothetical protein
MERLHLDVSADKTKALEVFVIEISSNNIDYFCWQLLQKSCSWSGATEEARESSGAETLELFQTLAAL